MPNLLNAKIPGVGNMYGTPSRAGGASGLSAQVQQINRHLHSSTEGAGGAHQQSSSGAGGGAATATTTSSGGGATNDAGGHSRAGGSATSTTKSDLPPARMSSDRIDGAALEREILAALPVIKNDVTDPNDAVPTTRTSADGRQEKFYRDGRREIL